MLSPFEVSVNSSELAVREALQDFLQALDPLKLDIEESGTVELVLAEVLNNIVEHAYPSPAPSGSIGIRCVHHNDGLHLTITDHGQAMPDGTAPLGRQAALNVDLMDLPEGGFGWFLIQDLARDVTYTRVGEENQLTMRLAVAMHA
ncbi:ATP-binding protein [Roseobacter insulae]|nr:ATP-binding protein [Roseobacter insulae]